MSESTSEYPTGVYVKDGNERTANTVRAAVELVFEGYHLKETVPAEDTTYRDLQAQAKELGIPANQSESALRAAIAKESLPAPATVVDEQPTDEKD